MICGSRFRARSIVQSASARVEAGARNAQPGKPARPRKRQEVEKVVGRLCGYFTRSICWISQRRWRWLSNRLPPQLPARSGFSVASVTAADSPTPPTSLSFPSWRFRTRARAPGMRGVPGATPRQQTDRHESIPPGQSYLDRKEYDRAIDAFNRVIESKGPASGWGALLARLCAEQARTARRCAGQPGRIAEELSKQSLAG